MSEDGGIVAQAVPDRNREFDVLQQHVESALQRAREKGADGAQVA